MLRRGWELISTSALDAAEESFLRCLNFAIIPEALVGLGYCQLLQGSVENAQNSIKRWLDIIFLYHECKDPDPVAWAMWIRVALCCGHVDAAMERASQFRHLSHRELDRIRTVLGLDDTEISNSSNKRPSIAPTPTLEGV
ncbi:hypothetical protein Q1M64_13020 (plasmid) [Sinorhizobium meliloti]|nr:hypothetical protein Q1M64_13020 [Sinorhizobium meliloti]